MINVLDEGEIDADGQPITNCMQMLHGAYNLQNWHETEELNELWEYLRNNENESDILTTRFKKLEEPIMTRWWLVGACACSFSQCLYIWTSICIAIRNSSPANSASNKITSCTLNLTRCPSILNDLYLLTGFHKAWLFTHFRFLQMRDIAIGDTPSFQAPNILVRYYLMDMDLQHLKIGYREHDNFRKFVVSYDKLKNDEKVNQEKSHFFITRKTQCINISINDVAPIYYFSPFTQTIRPPHR